VLTEVELETSEATFNTWFTDTQILHHTDGTVYIGVPNEFVKSWIAEKYQKKLKKLLRKFTDNVHNVEFEVTQTDANQNGSAAVSEVNASGQLPFENKQDEPDTEKKDTSDSPFNDEYSFDSFVVGSFNELAHAASQAVVNEPGSAYNPLFIYGKTGHGKTHLIQAIGNELANNGDHQAHYVTSEKFAVDYVNSVQDNNVNDFKKKYRKHDVLIMDDVQFLSKKKKTQEELFHLFNTMYDNNKQIVFSSDMHPNYLKDMEDRLKSRFNAGMIVDISPPEHESRVAILNKKAAERGIGLSEEVVQYIARSIKSNIRELEGALNSIAMQSRLSGGNLSLSAVKELIQDSINSQQTVNIDDVVETVANFFNIETDKIYEKTRKRKIVRPRQIAMFILREDYQFAYPEIGERIGDRDHTTVIHSYKKIKENLETDSDLVQDIHQIRSLI
jgi:chromosomal replication initiator protein